MKRQAWLPIALIRLYLCGEWQGLSPLQLRGSATAALTGWNLAETSLDDLFPSWQTAFCCKQRYWVHCLAALRQHNPSARSGVEAGIHELRTLVEITSSYSLRRRPWSLLETALSNRPSLTTCSRWSTLSQLLKPFEQKDCSKQNLVWLLIGASNTATLAIAPGLCPQIIFDKASMFD